MAKKKVRKVKKDKKVMRGKKAKKVAKAKKAIKAVKAKGLKEKVLGRVEHYFDKISVAATRIKVPFKVGDVIHIKGHTTDFFQRVESLQIEHQSVQKVKKGDDVGIKVKEFVRGHDMIYLAGEKDLAEQAAKPVAVQQPMFPAASIEKKETSSPASTGPKAYSDTKFLNF